MIATGTAISILVLELWICFVGCADVELVGAVTEVCDAEVEICEVDGWEVLECAVLEVCDVDGWEVVELEEEVLCDVDDCEVVELDEEVLTVGTALEVAAAPDAPPLSIAENGYGSSAVVRLVVQQS